MMNFTPINGWFSLESFLIDFISWKLFIILTMSWVGFFKVFDYSDFSVY